MPSGLPSVPEDYTPVLVNRVSGLCLWTDGMDPKYIDVDALPLSNGQGSTSQPGSPSSPVGARPSPLSVPLNGIVRTSLRIRLAIPYDQGSSTFNGFSGAVSFAAPLTTTAQCSTRVMVDGVTTSSEVAALIPILESQHGQQQQSRSVGLLPDSWLTRCHWLDANSSKTMIVQQIVVDGENICVLMYDIHRVHSTTASPHSAHSSPVSLSPASLHSASPPPPLPRSQSFITPTADLTLWNKVVDSTSAPPPQLLPLPVTPPANSGAGASGSGMPHRYGGDTFGGGASAANAYLYSTGAALAGAGQSHLSQQQQHSPSTQHQHQQGGFGIGGVPTPTHQRTASSGTTGAGRQAGAVVAQQGSRTPSSTSSTSESRQTTPTHTSYRPHGHGHGHSSSISSISSDLSSPTSPLTPLGGGFGSSSLSSASSAGSSSSGTLRSCASSSSAMHGLVSSYGTVMGRGFNGMGVSGMVAGYGGLYGSNTNSADGSNSSNTYLSGLDGEFGGSGGGGGGGGVGAGAIGMGMPGMIQHGSAYDPWTTSLLPLF